MKNAIIWAAFRTREQTGTTTEETKIFKNIRLGIVFITDIPSEG